MSRTTFICPALTLKCLCSVVIAAAMLSAFSAVQAGSRPGPPRNGRMEEKEEDSARPEQERSLLWDLVPGLQTNEERRVLQKIVDSRWNHRSIKVLGRWLLGGEDKVCGPRLQRSTAILKLFVYLRCHEKPFAFEDGQGAGVTVAETTRIRQLRGAIDQVLRSFYEKLFDPGCRWPGRVQSKLKYALTSALERHGAPKMDTEPIWKHMAEQEKFRRDMLGTIASIGTEKTLERLIRFRTEREWSGQERGRIGQAIRDLRWSMRRRKWLAKKHKSQERERPPRETDLPYRISGKETRRMRERVRQMRRGECPEIPVVSTGRLRRMLYSISLQYTKINSAVRSDTLLQDQTAAMKRFAGGKAHLLLMESRPGEEAMERYGEKWRKLDPERHQLAARTVAIIVNPANQLKSLTPAQVRLIYEGRLTDWRVAGRAGLPSPGGGDGPVPIEAYGLHPGHPTSPVFHRTCLPQHEIRGARWVKNTEQAVTRVSMNERAIAFVDFNRLPHDTDQVKVLWMQRGFGKEARLTPPQEITIAGGSYPFSEKLYLYVHPQAGEAARGFAEFIASCGYTAHSVYTNTVEEMTSTFRQNGLIPMEPEALKAMLEERVKRAKEERN